MIALTTLWLLAHSWYPPACCSGKDCYPVPCEEIHLRGEFYEYFGIRWSRDRAQPSEDGGCHVCINWKTNWGQCLFLGGVS